jgi:hypothetical protein
MSDGGKGHAQRPRSIADEEWARRWDDIFGRDKQSDDKDKQEKQDDQMVKPNSANM